jgi:hypothetical protein
MVVNMQGFRIDTETEALGSVHKAIISVNVAHTGDRWRQDLATAVNEARRQLRESIAHKRLVMGMDKPDNAKQPVVLPDPQEESVDG